MTETDATIAFVAVATAARYSASQSSLGGHHSFEYGAVTAVITQDSGDVVLEFSPLVASNQSDLCVDYQYAQLVENEDLVFKVSFSGGFPDETQFQVVSSDFPAFNIARQPLTAKELNATVKKAFTTRITLLMWMGSGEISGDQSVNLDFFKIVSSGGIDKQVKIAGAVFRLNNAQK